MHPKTPDSGKNWIYALQNAGRLEPGEYMRQKTRGDEGRERELEQIKSLEWGDDGEGADGEKRCAGGE